MTSSGLPSRSSPRWGGPRRTCTRRPTGRAARSGGSTRGRSSCAVQANRELYGLLKDGLVVRAGAGGDGDAERRARVIDWDHPEENDSFVAQQLWIQGEMHRRRADLIGGERAARQRLGVFWHTQGSGRIALVKRCRRASSSTRRSLSYRI